jgi:hypothetical protein
MNCRICIIFCQDRYSFRLFNFNDFFVEAELGADRGRV